MALKEEIAAGTLAPGERLYETALARRLQMSRTPVREALQRLQNEGLAEARTDGLYVRALTVQDVHELERVNRVLQGLAAELATAAGNPGDLEQLEAIMGRMEASTIAGDQAGWVAADRALHRHLRQMSGNQWLTRLLLQLEPLVGRVHYISFRRPGRMERSTHEHRAIVEAIRSGDPEVARQAMHEHLVQVERNLVEVLETFLVPLRGNRV